ncbi:MAG: hypothetical protein WC216_05885 [Gallionella sp.]|jgi:Ca2+-binding EF-hand superfamily protein
MSKLIVGFLFVFMPCMVFAADQPASKAEAKFDQVFRVLDTNNSGKLSRQEVALKAPVLVENFDQIDANHDGGLSKKEIRDAGAAAEKRRHEFAQNLEAADKDKNGKLSREEAAALPNISANFDAIDSNHDGQLVIKEIADYVRAMANTAQASSAASPVQ